MERTAVDWLFTTLDNIIELYPSEWEKVSKAVEEAKRIEKEQIEDAYNRGKKEHTVSSKPISKTWGFLGEEEENNNNERRNRSW
jgi:hypothetical protein